MGSKFWMIGAIALCLNTVVTYVVVRSHDVAWRKAVFLVATWVIPFIGAMLVLIGIGSPPASPSNRPDQPHIPW